MPSPPSRRQHDRVGGEHCNLCRKDVAAQLSRLARRGRPGQFLERRMSQPIERGVDLAQGVASGGHVAHQFAEHAVVLRSLSGKYEYHARPTRRELVVEHALLLEHEPRA